MTIPKPNEEAVDKILSWLTKAKDTNPSRREIMRLLSLHAKDKIFISKYILGCTGRRKELIASTMNENKFFTKLMEFLSSSEQRNILLAIVDSDINESSYLGL